MSPSSARLLFFALTDLYANDRLGDALVAFKAGGHPHLSVPYRSRCARAQRERYVDTPQATQPVPTSVQQLPPLGSQRNNGTEFDGVFDDLDEGDEVGFIQNVIDGGKARRRS